MDKEVFIARQPILNQRQSLIAYELLFRKRQGENQCSVLDDMTATAQVLDNALNNVGVNKLVGGNLAFVNCSYDILKSDILYALNPEIFVLEVLESVTIDDSIIDAVRNFKEKGYKIAVDDFVPSLEAYQRIAPLVPYSNIIKLEYPLTSAREIRRATTFFHSKNIKVLAEKVETELDFKKCQEAECDMFQGYFFSKPEMLSTSKIGDDIAGALDIIGSVDSGAEIEELEDKFKLQPQLSVNLIKYLNSAFFATRQEITSIRHAISLLGYSNLKRWLLILAYANNSHGSKQSPLLTNAIYRATFFESVAKSVDLGRSAAEKAYLMGLVSNMSALYKIPVEIILSQLSLDCEINDALIHSKGYLGEILKLDCCLETDNIRGMEEIMDRLGLSTHCLSDCMLKAYEASNRGLGE